jgi:phosphoglycerol transferase
MYFELLLSLACFLGSLAWSANHKRNNYSLIILAFLIFIYILGVGFFIVSDYFTGEGINAAVKYHVISGINGAGFLDFKMAIGIATGFILIGIATSVLFYKYEKRNRPNVINSKTKRFVSSLLFILSYIFSPTIQAAMESVWMELSEGKEGAYHSNYSFNSYFENAQPGNMKHKDLNIIYIYAESLERTYFDEDRFPGLISGLREIEKDSLSFLNIAQAPMTGWTVAGMSASQCGLPLVTTSGGNSFSGLNSIYASVFCLGDYLKSRGYELSFFQGSSINFSGIDKLFVSHGFDEVYGAKDLINHGKEHATTSAWGLYDDDLLDILYERFLEYSQKGVRFGLFGATIDTHAPSGHMPKSCANEKYLEGDNKMLNAVVCADKLLTKFIRKILDSNYSENTIIVITSDHLAMKNDASHILNSGERNNLFMIIDPSSKANALSNKPGTMLDVPSTILGVLGIEANIGLGRNLLSQNPSLISQIENFDMVLRGWRNEIKSLHDFPNLIGNIEITPHVHKIVISGKSYNFPILVRVKDDRSTQLYFDFHSPKKLYQYVSEQGLDDKFLWIDSCSTIGLLAFEKNHDDEGNGHCVAYGQLGGDITTNKLTSNLNVNSDNLMSETRTKSNNILYSKRVSSLLLHNKQSKFVGFINTSKAYAKSLFPASFYSKLKHMYYSVTYENSRSLDEIEIDATDTTRFIAHAGGRIDGKTYTNSLDALELSYSKGFRMFELDISKTLDGIFVAAHDWKLWKKHTAFTSDKIPTHLEFMSYKIHGKYSPLDMPAINRWFAEHADAILVTDKINEPLSFSKKFIDKKRLMMELFSYEKVLEAIDAEIMAPMPTWHVVSNIKGDKIERLKALGISNIATSRRNIEEAKGFFIEMMKNGIRPYVFHVGSDKGKDENHVVCHELDLAYGLYADNWDFNKNFSVEGACSL